MSNPLEGTLMLGSQALEVAIALALLYFVLATAASAVVEGCNQLLSVRAKQLEKAVLELVTNGVVPGAVVGLPADLMNILNLGAKKANANYISAKAFADATVQLVNKIPDSPSATVFKPLFERLDTLADQAHGDITTIKAGLETWFDDRMTDVQTQFKRYTTIFIFVVGLGITVGANASSVDVAQDLWEDDPARAAAVSAAERATTPDPGSSECASGDEIADAACSVRGLDEVGLPLGWAKDQREGQNGWWYATHLCGWMLTALLIMLGAPFWFDLLGRLVGVRNARVKKASDDPGSNTAMLTTPSAGPPAFRTLGVRGVFDQTEDSTTPTKGDGATDWLAIALNRSAPVPRPEDPAPGDNDA